MKRVDWRTPDGVWKALHAEYAFNLDAAASALNAKCPAYFDGETASSDGLLQPWTVAGQPARVWCNPPYNPTGAIEAWLTKGIEQAREGVLSVFLIPMSSSTGWFNDLVVPYAEWHTFRLRIAFEDPTADARENPKQDNLLVVFNPYSEVTGHTAVRCARKGEKLWTRA